jgi:hypothetical protein
VLRWNRFLAGLFRSVVLSDRILANNSLVVVHKSGPNIADLYAYKRRTGQVRACHESEKLHETWGVDGGSV